VSKAIIHSYLGDPSLSEIDALVLACTHYPLIAPIIDAYFNHKVTLLKSGEIVAKKLTAILQKENLLASDHLGKENEFIVSDKTKNFENSAKNFYGQRIKLKEVKL
jgi:glutamate racemase